MKEFINRVYESIKETMGDDYDISKQTIIKNNDSVEEAIVLKRKCDNVARCVYMRGYYNRYLDGVHTDSIAQEIIDDSMSDKRLEYIINTVSLEELTQYEKVKDKIIITLINKNKNEKYLSDKVHIEYLDLAIIFNILWENEDNEATSCVTKVIMDKWNISVEELFRNAFENTQRILPSNITNINEVILNMCKKTGTTIGEHDMEMLQNNEINAFYVLTNKIMNRGAICILYNDVLNNFASMFDVDEVIIIPASIHETLLIPKNDKFEMSKEQVADMVREINRTEVDYREVLSDNVYLYNRIIDRISIWNEI